MLGNPTKVNSATSESGIELNVKVNEDVPNHLCKRFFTNLEVGFIKNENDFSNSKLLDTFYLL